MKYDVGTLYNVNAYLKDIRIPRMKYRYMGLPYSKIEAGSKLILRSLKMARNPYTFYFL